MMPLLEPPLLELPVPPPPLAPPLLLPLLDEDGGGGMLTPLLPPPELPATPLLLELPPLLLATPPPLATVPPPRFGVRAVAAGAALTWTLLASVVPPTICPSGMRVAPRTTPSGVPMTTLWTGSVYSSDVTAEKRRSVTSPLPPLHAPRNVAHAATAAADAMAPAVKRMIPNFLCPMDTLLRESV
jgi:hypothetical protein